MRSCWDDAKPDQLCDIERDTRCATAPVSLRDRKLEVVATLSGNMERGAVRGIRLVRSVAGATQSSLLAVGKTNNQLVACRYPLDLNFAFQIKDASTLQLNAIADQSAQHLAAAARGLEGAEHSLMQFLRPVRRQHAMRAAGNRVLRNTLRWRKVAADKVVALIAWRSHDYAAAIHATDDPHIGRELSNDTRALEQH